MNTIQRLARTVLGAVVAVLLIVGFGGVASAEPPPAPVAATEAAAPAATPVAACMAPGDSLELRGAIAAVLGTTVGAILGVPVLLFGAIPGAIIGGVVGFMIGSAWYAVDAGQAPQNC